jgi:hypothetical protein
MCNPRRVKVELNRAIREAWRTTVEQTARAEGEVQELARVTVDVGLGAEMGDLPLQVLERLLRGEFPDVEPAWPRDEAGNYRRDLGDVVLVYNPNTHQLTVEAQLIERVEAEARAAEEVGGFTVGEVAVEAVAQYFDDGWGGRTEEEARRVAEADAERKLAGAVEEHHRKVHAEELRAAEGRARTGAEQQAAQELERRRKEVREALRNRLKEVLARAQERVNHTMNRLVGQAYRRALIQLVQQNGGRVVTDDKSGSVINLELELP